MRKIKWAAVVFVIFIVGCQTTSPTQYSFDSEDPLVRSKAILLAEKNKDYHRIGEIIDRLDDNALGVRTTAINTLRSMTGNDFGYKSYMNEFERKPYVEKWAQWWKSEGENKHLSSGN